MELGLSMLAGVIWSFGNVCSLYAVRGLGFSRAIPLFAVATIINAFYGILLFGELISDPMSVGILFLGMALLIAGIVMALSTYESKGKAATGLILLALVCGFFFGSYNAPIRATTVPPPNATAGLFLGMIITCVALGLVVRSWEKRRSTDDSGALGRREFLSAMISGVIWGVGTAWSIYSISKIGLALSFPIFQLNILVYIVWGLFYFKEIRKEKFWRVLAGTAIIIIGAVLVVGI
jgi:glucose uptake protein